MHQKVLFLAIVILWTSIHGTNGSCPIDAILCIGTLNNITAVNDGGCLSQKSRHEGSECRVSITATHDLSMDKVILTVTNTPGDLTTNFELIDRVYHHRTTFHFGPGDVTLAGGEDMKRVFEVQVAPGQLDPATIETIKVSSWSPKEQLLEQVWFQVAHDEDQVSRLLEERRRRRRRRRWSDPRANEGTLVFEDKGVFAPMITDEAGTPVESAGSLNPDPAPVEVVLPPRAPIPSDPHHGEPFPEVKLQCQPGETQIIDDITGGPICVTGNEGSDGRGYVFHEEDGILLPDSVAKGSMVTSSMAIVLPFVLILMY